MNFRRKRSRKQTVGCPCCHIQKNNSKARTKPKDRPHKDDLEVGESITIDNVEPTPKLCEAPRTWFLWDGEGPEP